MKLIEIWVKCSEIILWIILGILLLKFIASIYRFNQFLKTRPNKRIIKDLFKNEMVGKGEEKEEIKWWMKVILLIGFFITFLFIEQWVKRKYEKTDKDNSQDDCE